MFENTVTLHFRPGKTREALLVLRECVAPVIMTQKSLLGLCLLPNYEKDKVTIISVWASEARARGLEAQVAYRREIGKLDCFLSIQANLLNRQNSPPN